MNTPVGPPGPLPIVYHDARFVVDRRHYTSGRAGWGPQWIVLHSTEGTDSRAWLSTAPGSGVSIHKLIRPEGVYSLVAPRLTARWLAWFQALPPEDHVRFIF